MKFIKLQRIKPDFGQELTVILLLIQDIQNAHLYA
jgi:hypothetical protein